MPRPPVIERARKYVAGIAGAVSGEGRHNATVAVVNVLVHGFALGDDEAWAILQEWNQRCSPPNEEGSWTFIIVQSIILGLWVTANVIGWVKPWDPYPFILLNLALSFQAAYASPIIMMSQNRQARLADQRNHLALQVALLAEQEDTDTLRLLRKICEKLQIPMEETEPALEQRTDPEILIRQIKDADVKG